MTVTLNGKSVNVHFEVCPTCGGKGHHTNPSVDAGGLTSSDFENDPGFMEEYLSGIYNVRCYECDGKRVVPRTDDPQALAEIEEDEDFRRMQAAERSMGA